MSGDGDTCQVISSTTMDGSVSYLRFRTQGPPMTRPIPAPHAAAIGVRHAGRDPDACQELIWTSRVPLKPSPTRRKADQKKSPSHMSLTARDTPPRCSNSDLQHVRAE